MSQLKIDLHEIYNQGKIIKQEIVNLVHEAIEKKIPVIEIIHGKGKGQLKKNIIQFLHQPHIKKLYYRLEKDDKNSGRLFI